MICNQCQSANPDTGRFCTHCGVKLQPVCPACGADVAPAHWFCGACGCRLHGAAHADPVAQAAPSPVAAPRTAPDPAATAPDAAPGPGPATVAANAASAAALAEDTAGAVLLAGERRQATVLFADMAGYTALAERLGEESTYALMQPLLAAVVETVHAFGGTTQDLAGDGVMALFGVPHALEDAPLRACEAALEIQRRMARIAPAGASAQDDPPRFRVGVHCGPVVMGEMGDGKHLEYRAVGDTVNLTSRLQGLARPGQVLLSQEVNQLVQGRVSSTDMGLHSVKGKAQPIRVYQLDAVRHDVARFQALAGRGLTGFVGRDREIEQMEQVWAQARAGATRVIDLSGEAGMGKSRLVHEFCARRQSGTTVVLRGQCQSGGRGGAFRPLIDVVRHAFRIDTGEPADRATSKLERGLSLLGIDVASNAPYLLNLLGYPVAGAMFSKENAELSGIRTRDLLVRLIRERCQISETILVIEDVQWIDQPSMDLLAITVGAGLRLLLLCTYRPPCTTPWSALPITTHMPLKALPQGSVEDLLRQKLATDRLPDGLARLVIDRAEGNPLFAEEIVLSLQERGALRQDAAGLQFDDSAALALPSNLENLLMGRLDDLDAAQRALLQAASVVGRRFDLDVAAAAAALDVRAADVAQELERLELIVREPQPGVYRFRNALLQETLLHSLLTGRRRDQHERVALALEAKHGARAAELAHVLAHHYGQTPRAEKAVHYMRLAGEQALRVYSLDEAELRLRQVIDLIAAVPGCADDAFLIDSLLNVSRVLYYKAEFIAVVALVEPHLPLAERLGDPARLGRLLFELGYAHVFNANSALGKPLLERALAIGEETGNDTLCAYASMGLLWHYLSWAPPTAETRAQVHSLSERAEAIGRRIDDRWVTMKAMVGLGTSYNAQGRPSRARAQALRLIDYGRETGDPRGRGMGLWVLAFADAFSFDFPAAIDNGEESIRVALGAVDRQPAQMAIGVARVLDGRVKGAATALQGLIAQFERQGFKILASVGNPIVGAGLVAQGEWSRGVRHIEAEFERAERLQAPQLAAMAHATLGEVYTRVALGQAEVTLGAMVRNIGFVLGTVPRAAAKARHHLSLCTAMARESDNPLVLTWGLLNLGRIAARQKKPAQARAHWNEARAVAAENDLQALAYQIDAGLAQL